MKSPHTTVITSDTPVSVSVSAESADTDRWFFRVWRHLVDVTGNNAGLWASLSLSAKAVLIPLYAYVNDQQRKDSGRWVAFPSIRTLATKAGLKDRATQNGVKELEELGIIEVSRGGGKRRNLFEMRPPSKWVVHGDAPVHHGASLPVHGDAPKLDRDKKREAVAAMATTAEPAAAAFLPSAVKRNAPASIPVPQPPDNSVAATLAEVGVDAQGCRRVAAAIAAGTTSEVRVAAVVANMKLKGQLQTGAVARTLALIPLAPYPSLPPQGGPLGRLPSIMGGYGL